MPYIRKQLQIPNNDTETLIKFQNFPNNREKNISLHGKCLCFGAADNLQQHIKQAQYAHSICTKPWILAADGAAAELFAHNIIPNIVFTDLDGGADIIQACINNNVTLFVLVHGDNHKLVDKYHQMLINYKQTVWCTQGLPLFGFTNTLGFTDGDRMIAYAIQQGCQVLTLGFDLQSTTIGQASIRNKSFTMDYMKKKLIKLRIAGEIITELAKSGRVYTLDSKLVAGKETSLEQFLSDCS